MNDWTKAVDVKREEKEAGIYSQGAPSKVWDIWGPVMEEQKP